MDDPRFSGYRCCGNDDDSNYDEQVRTRRMIRAHCQREQEVVSSFNSLFHTLFCLLRKYFKWRSPIVPILIFSSSFYWAVLARFLIGLSDAMLQVCIYSLFVALKKLCWIFSNVVGMRILCWSWSISARRELSSHSLVSCQWEELRIEYRDWRKAVGWVKIFIVWNPSG